MCALEKSDSFWMQRCFDLARRGIGYVSPNPPVGAVLVYQNRILGEGYHTRFGEAHAEVEYINSVPEADKHLIEKATLYVSLEPCCIQGKTPACTDLILREGIKDIRISVTDPNPKVSGQSISMLSTKGISVQSGIEEEEGKDLIRAFRTNILLKRPHITLKWAQSKFGYIGTKDEQVWLSGDDSRVWTHAQRAEQDAILIGARTAERDNPLLTTRYAAGRSPHRVIYDPAGRLPVDLNVFKQDGCRVFYFSKNKNTNITAENISCFQLSDEKNPINEMISVLFEHNIGKLLVEGGSHTLQLFIERNLWDEAWVIQTQHPLQKGLTAPSLSGRLLSRIELGQDRIIGMQRIE